MPILLEELHEQQALLCSESAFYIARCALSRNSLYSASYDPSSVDLGWMTNMVRTLPQIRDQKSTGTCWLQAACALLDTIMQKQHKGFESSVAYLAFYDKLEKSNVFLHEAYVDKRSEWHSLTHDLSDGGTWSMFVFLVRKYGVAPSYSFGETEPSSTTDELNDVLSNYLRHARINQCDCALLDVHRALLRAYGPPPKHVLVIAENHVSWEGSPNDLFETACIDFNSYVLLAHAPDRKCYTWYISSYTNDLNTPDQEKVFTVPYDEIQSACALAIDHDNVVWFTCDMSRRRDSSSARASMAVRNPQKLLGLTEFDMQAEESKALRMKTGGTTPEHAMLIIGYRRVKERIEAWKVQNSWGKNQNDGFIHMTDDWMFCFGFLVAVPSKFVSICCKQKMLAASKVKCPLWDVLAQVA